MQSISLTPPSHLPLLSSSRGPTFLKPLKPSSPPKTLLRFSLTNPTPNNPTPNPKSQSLFTTLLKPTLITLTATAALFLFTRFPLSIVKTKTTPIPIQPLLTETEKQEQKILEDRLTSNPDDIPTLRSLLELKSLTDQLPQAIPLADRLITLLPNDPDPTLQKADLQLLTGNTNSAKQLFEDVLSKNPLNVEAYRGLVLSASGRNKRKEVAARIENVIKALEEEEDKRDAVVDLKLLVVQVRIVEGRLREALRLCKEVEAMVPGDFRPYMSLGTVYSFMGRRSEAADMFREFRRLAPEDHPFREVLDKDLI